MDNQRIQVTECKDVTERARKMLNDERIGWYPRGSPYSTFLSSCRETITSILRFAGGNGYLTQKQIDLLKGKLKIYDNLVGLNASFEKDLPNSAYNLLEKVVEFSELHINGDKSLQIKKTRVKQKAENIKRKEYFWDYHISSAKELLEELSKRGINNKDLEGKINELMERVSIK